jgi:hypothetical protein
VDVKVPGVMAMLVAPVVAQLSVLLWPEVMLAGLAVKMVMVGTAGVTVTVTVLVIAVPLVGVTVRV